MDDLSPEDASAIIGVPPVQIRRWAILGNGPHNIGSRWKPKYRRADLDSWLVERQLMVPEFM